MSDETATKKLTEQTQARIRDATMNNKRLLPKDIISQQEARKLFRHQPEQPPSAFYITHPGINGWHPAWQPPIPNTEHQDHLDDMPPLLPPTFQSTLKNKDARHSDGPCELWKAKLTQDTYVCGSGGEQKPSHP